MELSGGEEEPWVRELEPTECEQWHYSVAAAVTWLGSRGLQMCDITVSNLGLEGEDGTLMLFDMAGWSITGAPAWGGGSGFMSYLQSRCPAVLSVIQSHGEVDSAKCLQIWASELGLSANCWPPVVWPLSKMDDSSWPDRGPYRARDPK